MRKGFNFIYRFGTKIFGGKGLRKNPFFNFLYIFLSKRVRRQCVEVNGYRLHLDVLDGIDPGFGFEEKTTNLFKSLVKDGDTIIDIGADVGYYTCLAAKLSPSGHVYAFEPNARSLSLLKRNVEENNFVNVTVIGKAVSNIKGRTHLYLHGSHSSLGYNRFSSPIFPTEVETVDLDSFFMEIPANIALIKMDIEGSEVKALYGMKNLLRNNKNVKLIVEFYPKLLRLAGSNPKEFLEILTGLGFSFYDIEGEHGVHCRISAPQLLREYSEKGDFVTNLFCIRK